MLLNGMFQALMESCYKKINIELVEHDFEDRALSLIYKYLGLAWSDIKRKNFNSGIINFPIVIVKCPFHVLFFDP